MTDSSVTAEKLNLLNTYTTGDINASSISSLSGSNSQKNTVINSTGIIGLDHDRTVGLDNISTSFDGFEIIRLDDGSDIANVSFSSLTETTVKKSLRIDGGNGVDSLNLSLNSNEHKYLETTNQLHSLNDYLNSPAGKNVTFNFLQTRLTLSGFENSQLNIDTSNPVSIRGNSFYTIADGPSWITSERNSNKVGGNLVTINDNDEFNWILDTYSDYETPNTTYDWQKHKIYIGYTDQDSEGNWTWVSGEESTYNPVWAKGMPDNGGGIEDYAELYLANTQHWMLF